MTTSVSIVIPTLDADSTLGRCLAAIRDQTTAAAEVIVVDGGSTDGTVELASQDGCRVISAPGGILIARAIGARASRGDWILLLDSDQLLRPRTIEMITAARGEALILEERAAPGSGLVRLLFDLDRRLVHLLNLNDPDSGVLMPRAFRREVLLRALDRIPLESLRDVVSEDHMIIHKEVTETTDSFCTLLDAVEHMERENIGSVLHHYFRFGRATAATRRNRTFLESYAHLARTKRRPRPFCFRHPMLSLASFLLTAVKYAAYRSGEVYEAVAGRTSTGAAEPRDTTTGGSVPSLHPTQGPDGAPPPHPISQTSDCDVAPGAVTRRIYDATVLE